MRRPRAAFEVPARPPDVPSKRASIIIASRIIWSIGPTPNPSPHRHVQAVVRIAPASPENPCGIIPLVENSVQTRSNQKQSSRRQQTPGKASDDSLSAFRGSFYRQSMVIPFTQTWAAVVPFTKPWLLPSHSPNRCHPERSEGSQK